MRPLRSSYLTVSDLLGKALIAAGPPHCEPAWQPVSTREMANAVVAASLMMSLICAIHLYPLFVNDTPTPGPASKALVRPACGPSRMARSSQWRPQVAGKTQPRRAAPCLDDNL